MFHCSTFHSGSYCRNNWKMLNALSLNQQYCILYKVSKLSESVSNIALIATENKQSSLLQMWHILFWIRKIGLLQWEEHGKKVVNQYMYLEYKFYLTENIFRVRSCICVYHLYLKPLWKIIYWTLPLHV